MSILQKFWQRWKQLGQIMGDLLARLVLTIFYFTIFMPFGLMVSLFGDPLGMKSNQSSRWLKRSPSAGTLDDARRLG